MSLLKGQISVNIKRIDREPLERRFVEFWREWNGIKDMTTRGSLLRGILNPNPEQGYVCSDRDMQVAESVVQWLGSDVGQDFLKEVVMGGRS